MNSAFRGALLVAGLFVLAAGSSQAEELKVGETYHGSVQLTADSGGIILPLPKGDWQLVALEPSRHTRDGANLAALSGALVSLELNKQKKLKSFITFYIVASDMFHGGWKVPPYCEANDLLYLQRTEAHRRKEIRCWGIKSFGLGVTPNTSQWLRDTYDWIAKNTVNKPASVIGVTYFRASGPKLLGVQYLFNPEAAGQPRTGWTNDLVSADPKKTKYIESLKSFGARWEPRIETGFAGKAP